MSDGLKAWLLDYLRAPDLLTHYPYYVHILAAMDPVDDPSVEVMAVSTREGRFWLHVNVRFFVQNPRFLRGVLLHEVHHLALGHLSPGPLREVPHRDLMDVAMEISANEFIREPLPGEPIVWEQFKHLGIAPGQSTMERYERLVRARDEGRDPVPPERSTWIEGSRRGSGFPSPGEDPPDPGAAHRVRDLIETSRAIVERTGKPTGAAGLLAGSTPGTILERLGDTLQPPARPLDWRTAVQMFLARMRAPEHTWSRPNRRFPSRVGQVPGRRYGSVQGGRPRLVVAIDTSASMSSEELTEIGRHLRVLSALAAITVVECDTEIQRVYRFESVLRDAQGRGGTDLRPVFDRDFLREHKPDGVVYFTDGEGPFHKLPPSVRTLWVLTRDTNFGCTWGERAILRESPAGY